MLNIFVPRYRAACVVCLNISEKFKQTFRPLYDSHLRKEVFGLLQLNDVKNKQTAFTKNSCHTCGKEMTTAR